LPIDPRKSRGIRHYSIANSPNSEEVELVIVKKEGGKGTDYLWTLDVGDYIELGHGASGIMTIDDYKKNFIFICTGTGISPFKSILEYIQEENIETGDIHLVFGTRREENILYFKEMQELVKTLPKLNYHIILSREPWEGRQGYVHEVYKEIIENYFQAMENGDYNELPLEFFICGWKDMVNEARKNLFEIGFDKKQVKVEVYE
jgi:CDP-4-dehydro-6-deoxyglucose reductase